MKSNYASKRPDSATTRRNERPRGKSEAEFLEKKATVAKTAALQTVKDMGRNLLASLNVKGWAERFPLATTAVAAATGFIVGEKIVSPDRPKSGAVEKKGGEKSGATLGTLSALLFTTATDILKDLAHTYVSESLHQRKLQKVEDETKNPVER